MTLEELENLFEEHSYRPIIKSDKPLDLEVFNHLHNLLPDTSDIVACAEHDQIWLGFDLDKFCEVATEADVLYLIDRNVFISNETFSMYV